MLALPATQTKTGVFLTAGWHHLAMLNFPVDPVVLQPYLPLGVELDTWHGQTFLSVVGFQFVDTRVLGISIPFHRHFSEVNLRFYVRRLAAEGWRRGVVFLREIAPRFMVSLIARWLYNEKYVTMPVRPQVTLPVGSKEGLAQYEWWHHRRWNSLSVRIHGEPTQPAVGSLEEFIAEHYWGYSRQPDGGTVEYQVAHRPWRVWSASSARYDCDVEAIYGKEFVPYLREPGCAFVADGSPVVVHRGVRLAR